MPKVAVIGGDLRALEAAKILMAHGCACSFFGSEELPENKCRGVDLCRCSEPYLLFEAMEGADLILLPLPFSRGGESLNAPFSRAGVAVGDLLAALPDGRLIVGGGLPATVTAKARRAVDLLLDEDFARANALPTAEGAVGMALLQYPDVIEDAPCAVLGYGRIGRALTEKLKALGARVKVFARREESRTQARAAGVRALSFDELTKNAHALQIVFNTVPDAVFPVDAARALPPDALYFELASRPYGATEEARKLLGERLISASGLPGRYAPRYAGALIARRVLSLLSDDEKRNRETERNRI